MKIKRFWYATNTGWKHDKYEYVLRNTEAINVRNGKPYFKIYGYCEETRITHIMDVNLQMDCCWVVNSVEYVIQTKEQLFNFKNLLDSIIIDEALK